MGGSQEEIDALRAQVAALTARVYQLEQRAPAASGPAQEAAPQRYTSVTNPSARTDIRPPGAPVESQPHLPYSVPAQFRKTPSVPIDAEADLEKKIGQYWLNRVGIVAILIGVSYFLKYAFENDWIGPGGRIAIGLLAGIGLVIWSESFRHRGHKTFSYSLKAIGIGTLYLSLWGAFQVYRLIPASSAFAAMVVVTGATIALALTQDAELLASFALIGGFATPLLLSTGENQ